MNWFGTTLALGLVALGSAAGATTINFDGSVGGGPPDNVYVESGYAFTPNLGSNDGKCSDPPCLNEYQQGEITTMTAVDGSAFNLDGFSFILVGNGTDPADLQNIVVSVEYEDGSTASMLFNLDDLLTDFGADFALVGVTDPLDTSIDKNDEYAVSVLNGLFDGVVSVSWTTNYASTCVESGSGKDKDKVKCKPQSAQARLDTIIVSTPAPVPLPAAGLLLLGGLGALGALRRRRAA